MFIPKYKVVLFSDNKTHSLVKIKYGQFNYQSANEVDFYLLYDKNNDMLLPLEEIESKHQQNANIIYFVDSRIERNKSEIIYTDAQLTLSFSIIDNTKPIYRKLKEAIDDYLLLLSFKK